MKLFGCLLVASLIAGCSSGDKKSEMSPEAQAQAQRAAISLPTSLEEAVKSEFRTEANRARDQFRHPKETLEFFGLGPNMTVVEIAPGTGWYSQILAPYLSQTGKYVAASPPVGDREYMKKMSEAYQNWLKSYPQLQEKVTLATFNPPGESIAPEGTADMVLTFRNVHNWVAQGTGEAAFKEFFKALKPGGILGVVEHRENPRAKRDPKAKNGYVREADVIQMATKAGFKLEAKSEINANPKDTKRHPEGVWTLPPTYRLGDKDRAKYEAIGESDRMTLKFVKPAK